MKYEQNHWHEDGAPSPISLGSYYPQALENIYMKKKKKGERGAAMTSVIIDEKNLFSIMKSKHLFFSG